MSCIPLLGAVASKCFTNALAHSFHALCIVGWLALQNGHLELVLGFHVNLCLILQHVESTFEMVIYTASRRYWRSTSNHVTYSMSIKCAVFGVTVVAC